MEVYKFLGVLPAFMKVAGRFPPMTMYKLPEGKEPLQNPSKVVSYSPPTADIPYVGFRLISVRAAVSILNALVLQPNILALGQDRHEAMLRSELEKHNCFVELGTELQSFEHHADQVVAHISTTRDGVEHTETTKFAWLVGTDGAHSVVRKQLGLSFLGESIKMDPFAVADIHVKKGLAKDVGRRIFVRDHPWLTSSNVHSTFTEFINHANTGSIWPFKDSQNARTNDSPPLRDAY